MFLFYIGFLEIVKDMLDEFCYYVVLSVIGDGGYIFLSIWFYFLIYFILWVKFFCFLINGENKVLVKIRDFW